MLYLLAKEVKYFLDLSEFLTKLRKTGIINRTKRLRARYCLVYLVNFYPFGVFRKCVTTGLEALKMSHPEGHTDVAETWRTFTDMAQ